MNPQLAEIARMLAWHAQVQTYLLIALAAFALAGCWAISRDRRAISRVAKGTAARREPRDEEGRC